MSGEKVYECRACGLHYENENLAVQCETWCTKNLSCNVDIARSSVEYKRRTTNTQL